MGTVGVADFIEYVYFNVRYLFVHVDHLDFRSYCKAHMSSAVLGFLAHNDFTVFNRERVVIDALDGGQSVTHGVVFIGLTVLHDTDLLASVFTDCSVDCTVQLIFSIDLNDWHNYSFAGIQYWICEASLQIAQSIIVVTLPS